MDNFKQSIYNGNFNDVTLVLNDDYTFMGHFFVLTTSPFFDKYFRNTKPEPHYENNKFCNKYNLNFPTDVEAFKLSLNLIYKMYFKEPLSMLNDVVLKAYSKPNNDDDPSSIFVELLYMFDFLFLDGERMYMILKICYDNIGIIKDKKRLFTAINEVQTIDVKHKTFFNKYFYDKCDEMKEVLSEMNINVNNYLNHKEKYIITDKSIIINGSVVNDNFSEDVPLKNNLRYTAFYVEVDKIVYMLYFINFTRHYANDDGDVYLTYVDNNSKHKEYVKYDRYIYLGEYPYRGDCHLDNCKKYQYMFTSFLRNELHHKHEMRYFNTSEHELKMKTEFPQHTVTIYIDYYDLINLTVTEDVPLSNNSLFLDDIKGTNMGVNAKTFNIPNDFYDKYSVTYDGNYYDRTNCRFTTNKKKDEHHLKIKIVKT